VAADARRAVTLFAQACATGDGEGCRLAGDQLAGRDRALARAAYDKGCAAHDALSCARSAQGADATRALALHLQACELEHAPSCVDAAARLVAGRGGPADPARARQLLDPPCQGGDGAACQALALLLARATGGPRNWGEAIALHRKACGLGQRAACAAADKLERHPPDWHCATEAACARLCAEKLGRSCTRLADLTAGRQATEALATADPVVTCEDVDEAYEQGCDAGDGAACLRRGHGASAPERATGWYERGCRLGDREACVLQDFLHHADAEPAERRSIMGSLESGCAGNPGSTACVQLGRLLGDTDDVRANALLDQACRAGNGRACRIQLQLARACRLGDLRACGWGSWAPAEEAAMQAAWRSALVAGSCGRSGPEWEPFP
jgi:TPR repeat protein